MMKIYFISQNVPYHHLDCIVWIDSVRTREDHYHANNAVGALYFLFTKSAFVVLSYNLCTYGDRVFSSRNKSDFRYY